jgi:hypothetical protein
MHITVSATRMQAKGGAAVRVTGMPLTGFGASEGEAIQDATEGVTCWCRALSRQGFLEEAAKRAGATIEEADTRGVSVTIHMCDDPGLRDA